MQEIFKQVIPLTASDIDNHRRVRLSALLSYLQNMATEHAVILDFSGDRMIREHGVVWMMARLHLSLTRPILFDDGEMEVHTWHRGVTKSASVFRDFDIFVGGERVGECVTSWVLVDMKEPKIVKPSSISWLLDVSRPAVIKELVPGKIKMPEALQHAMTRPVYYSDTDLNGHMNNTKYADIACDAIRYEGEVGRFISELQVNYLQESFPGDVLGVLCAAEDHVYFVRGVDGDGRPRFEVKLSLSE